MNIIDKNIDSIEYLCEKYKVKELYIFGSILTERFNETSDIDLLIQFDDVELINYFDNYMDFKDELESLLKYPVDLVENQAIKNPIFRKIVDRDKRLVYERKSAQIYNEDIKCYHQTKHFDSTLFFSPTINSCRG
ncbi:MAG: nucleotidyltransferase domain-containing protein [Mariniphaga sp.]|nr:nucleotidyltransferase domain-containing protein [Mariniphaga sp.]MDD4426616.1 nucleotidyltransferase domain-containing protein [Mariniphaga sp.]